MNMPTQKPLDRATQAYQKHQKDWQFLGYSEPLALAILREFLGMKKKGRRNSQKPLNVLSVVGKRRILVIKEELEHQLRQVMTENNESK
jgi:hypothetical protein